MSMPLIPRGLIVPPLLVSFALMCVQYYVRNPARRVTDFRFLLALAAAALAFGSVLSGAVWPHDRLLSVVLFALAIVLLLVSLLVVRRARQPRPGET
jgi:phosphate starvation-inducible membrane PsiE